MAVFEFFVMLNSFHQTVSPQIRNKGFNIEGVNQFNVIHIPVLFILSHNVALFLADLVFYRALMCLSSSTLRGLASDDFLNYSTILFPSRI